MGLPRNSEKFNLGCPHPQIIRSVGGTEWGTREITFGNWEFQNVFVHQSREIQNAIWGPREISLPICRPSNAQSYPILPETVSTIPKSQKMGKQKWEGKNGKAKMGNQPPEVIMMGRQKWERRRVRSVELTCASPTWNTVTVPATTSTRTE